MDLLRDYINNIIISPIMEESLDVMPKPKLFSMGASAVYKQTSPVDILFSLHAVL